MKKIQALVSEIREYCAAHENVKGKAKWERYFKEGFDAWGLLEKDDPLWTVKDREWAGRYAGLGLKGFIDAGCLLFPSGKYEEGALAVRFVKGYRDEIGDEAVQRIGKWFEAGVANWAHTDVICGELLAPAVAAGKVKLETIGAWRDSEYKFQRRAVAVSLLALVKEGGKVNRLLDLVEPLMMDQERVVHQGVGWLLRECWKKDAKPVEEFLMKWKDRAPRLIYQYATEKMTGAQKSRFRASRKASAK